MSKLKLPTKEYLREVIEYKDGALFWKHRVGSSSVLIGKETGYIDTYGYRFMKIKNKKYATHRLIWIYHHGFIQRI